MSRSHRSCSSRGLKDILTISNFYIFYIQLHLDFILHCINTILVSRVSFFSLVHFHPELHVIRKKKCIRSWDLKEIVQWVTEFAPILSKLCSRIHPFVLIELFIPSSFFCYKVISSCSVTILIVMISFKPQFPPTSPTSIVGKSLY